MLASEVCVSGAEGALQEAKFLTHKFYASGLLKVSDASHACWVDSKSTRQGARLATVRRTPTVGSGVLHFPFAKSSFITDNPTRPKAYCSQ